MFFVVGLVLMLCKVTMFYLFLICNVLYDNWMKTVIKTESDVRYDWVKPIDSIMMVVLSQFPNDFDCTLILLIFNATLHDVSLNFLLYQCSPCVIFFPVSTQCCGDCSIRVLPIQFSHFSLFALPSCVLGLLTPYLLVSSIHVFSHLHGTL